MGFTGNLIGSAWYSMRASLGMITRGVLFGSANRHQANLGELGVAA